MSSPGMFHKIGILELDLNLAEQSEKAYVFNADTN